ncbi:N-acetyl sugar amidotransferase [Luminiphilus sp.]|nr:N-acetyl sugar amidotransferase [Luminiphilus sp.]
MIKELSDDRIYQVCTYCVMDTSVPDIRFNEEGTCNYCLDAKDRLDQDLCGDSKFDAYFNGVIETMRKEGVNRPYDCIIGVSGGVDSTYVAYLLKTKYHLRPLAIHFDNGWNSELAVQNIENTLKVLDIDLITHVVNWHEFSDLQLSFLKGSIPNAEIPTDHAITALLYQSAAKHNVRYIVTGSNLATEAIMPEVWMYDAKDLRFIKAVHRSHGTQSLSSYPMMSYSRLAWYIIVKRIKFFGLLNYTNFDKNKATSILKSELGWRSYEEKHFESIYTRFFQGYLLPKKFGIDKRIAHYSSLIVSEQLSRSDAVDAMMDNSYTSEKANQDVEYICKKLNLSQDEFNEIVNLPVKSVDDYPNSKWMMQKLPSLAQWFKDIATGRNKHR